MDQGDITWVKGDLGKSLKKIGGIKEVEEV